MPRMSASGKRIGRPPKKGTHLPVNSMQAYRSATGSPPPPDGADGQIKRKRKSPNKRSVHFHITLDVFTNNHVF